VGILRDMSRHASLADTAARTRVSIDRRSFAPFAVDPCVGTESRSLICIWQTGTQVAVLLETNPQFARSKTFLLTSKVTQTARLASWHLPTTVQRPVRSALLHATPIWPARYPAAKSAQGAALARTIRSRGNLWGSPCLVNEIMRALVNAYRQALGLCTTKNTCAMRLSFLTMTK
jgi:hypothetical protein